MGSDGKLFAQNTYNIKSGTNPNGMAVSPDGKTLYIVEAYGLAPNSTPYSATTPGIGALVQMPIAADGSLGNRGLLSHLQQSGRRDRAGQRQQRRRWSGLCGQRSCRAANHADRHRRRPESRRDRQRNRHLSGSGRMQRRNGRRGPGLQLRRQFEQLPDAGRRVAICRRRGARCDHHRSHQPLRLRDGLQAEPDPLLQRPGQRRRNHPALHQHHADRQPPQRDHGRSAREVHLRRQLPRWKRKRIRA